LDQIRAELQALKAISATDVVGLARHEAQFDVAYLGPIEQLMDALAQRNLNLQDSGGQYTLEFGTVAIAKSQ
jgi:hypothetical protein